MSSVTNTYGRTLISYGISNANTTDCPQNLKKSRGTRGREESRDQSDRHGSEYVRLDEPHRGVWERKAKVTVRELRGFIKGW